VALSAKVGVTLFIGGGKLELSKNSRIGSFSVFRDLRLLMMGEGSSVGNLNWITASKALVAKGARGTLAMGDSSVITNRHYLDVSGGLSLGNRSAIWGVRSTVMTHGIKIESWKQDTQSVDIGDDSVIGSNSIVCPGTKVPNGSSFGMGALLSGQKYLPNMLYVNTKASISREISPRIYLEND
jgi:acetyltransferase-like isoleucine patch superfamily enzyme